MGLVLDYECLTKCGTVSVQVTVQGESMSKGNERKKEIKKKPAKNLMEKRAAKAEKRDQKKKWSAP